ncbi:solute carrier organic anion transporter family member 2A1-like [Battus philenor]|uniref:solute carrier organic anion transporter family member 2A1-like n=1 Tax=Battus philenor TaxID=42288 RepID=UPI0035CF4AB1
MKICEELITSPIKEDEKRPIFLELYRKIAEKAISYKKIWYLLRTYILTVARFDLFLQGALLIVILLETNVYLLLRRNAGTGFLHSINEDWVKVGAAGAEFLLGAALGWWGRSWRHLALSGCLGVTAASGLIVLAFPYEESQPLAVELCGGGAISAYNSPISDVTSDLDPYMVPRTVFLCITAVLCALTKISIWSHGLSYLDDHEPHNGPYFYGILISIRLSLGLNGQSWLRPGAVEEDWWHAHISLCMLTLMFSILFTLFPKRMPQFKEIIYEADSGLWSSFTRVFHNRAVMLQTLALSLLYAGLFGFISNDTKFIQARFHIESLRQDPRTSRAINDIFRSLVIIFFVTIFRMRFSVRRSDGVKATTASKVGGVVAVFVSVFFVVLAVLGCSAGDIVGVGDDYSPPACSSQCGCDTARYGFSPVCAVDEGLTYFSPCDAGCRQYQDLKGFVLFENCTCGMQRAIRGSCSVPNCQTVYSVYLLIFALVLAAAGASIMMQGMVVLRSVERQDKPFALGFSYSIIGLLAHLLGHLFYMLISNLTCAYKENGVCIFHHPTVWWMAVTSAILSLLSAAVSVIASRVTPLTDYNGR